MFLVPDVSTYRILPWTQPDRRIARIICDVYRPDGEMFEGSPRTILRAALEEAKAMGYTYNTGAELEFYLLRRNGDKVHPVPHDVGGYFDFSLDMASTIREDMALALQSMGMEVEMTHHEVGPGQHEMDVRFSDALSCADNALTVKYTVKAIAAGARSVCHVHAQADLRHTGKRHARPSEPVRCQWAECLPRRWQFLSPIATGL